MSDWGQIVAVAPHLDTIQTSGLFSTIMHVACLLIKWH